MSSNKLPAGIDPLFAQAEYMIEGCGELESSIGLMHTTGATLSAAHVNASSKDNAYQAAKTSRLNATAAFKTNDDNGKVFLLAASNVLKRYLGTRWSQTWEETGFPNQSTAVPTTIDERLQVLQSLKLYFTGHAAQENQALGVTAGQAGALHDALLASRDTVHACNADLAQKKAARDEALKALRKKMQDLINELSQLLSGSDPRWLRFRLNLPDAVDLAEIVGNVRVESTVPKHLVVSWDRSVRAQRYRLRKQVVGVDSEFVDGPTVTGTTVDLNTFNSGSIVRVQVTAINEAGETQPSTVVEKQVA